MSHQVTFFCAIDMSFSTILLYKEKLPSKSTF